MSGDNLVAFISRRFVPNDVVDAICTMLAPDVECRPASDLKLRPIPAAVLDQIRAADLLIAIITRDGDSSWIQNELGMAYALGKPILVFYEVGTPIDGFAPMVHEYVTFDRSSLATVVNDKPRLIKGIRHAVGESRANQRELALREQRKYCGFYDSYHIDNIRDTESRIIRSCVEVSMSTILQVKIRSAGYSYSGSILEKNGALFVLLEGTHPENMLFVFGSSLRLDFDVLTGVFAAVSESGVPVCGKMLWHKVPGGSPSEVLRVEQCDARIVAFLKQPGNPIKVPKRGYATLAQFPG